MKNNRKIIFNKKDVTEDKVNRAKNIWTILFIVAFVIYFLIFILMNYYRSSDPYTYFYTSCALVVGIGFLIVFLITGLLLFINPKKKKVKNPYFLVKQNKSNFRIVETLSNVDGEIYQDDDIVNQPETLAYKEELIEKQHNKNVNLVTSFPEFSHFVNEYFLQKGFKTDVGFELVASIATSPLIFLKPGENNFVFLENINGCFNSPNLIIDGSTSESISNDYALFDAINTARSFKNSPVFLLIKNLSSDRVESYLAPLHKYFNNRNNATIQLSNNIVKIPNNLYVIVSLNNESKLALVASDVLKHATVVEFNCTRDASVENANPKPIELGDFNIVYALNRLKNESFLMEEYWKKVDTIEELLVRVGYPKFDNKVLSHLESYVSILINSLDDQLNALDGGLANLILLPALTACGPLVFKGDNDIVATFNTLFDDTEMAKSREVMKSYFAMYDKEGNLL